MRFCVSCRQPLEVQAQADELLVEYKDLAFIDNYIDEFENNIHHYFIIQIPKNTIINWDYMVMYKEKLNEQLMLEINDLDLVEKANEYNIKFCWGYPATNYYELHQLMELGASVITISGQLVFDKEQLTKLNYKYRLIPNYAMNIFPNDTGVCGSWIRPEVLKEWDDIVESCFFISKNLTQERTVFEIYKEGSWQDDLMPLIEGLNEPLYNQYLGTTINTLRFNCKQKCMIDEKECNHCNRIKKLGYIIHEAVLNHIN